MNVDAFRVPVEQQRDVRSYLLLLGTRCEAGIEAEPPTDFFELSLLDFLTPAFASLRA